MGQLSAALKYHAAGRAGKFATALIKPLATQLDLAMAYTPGVAEPVLEIARNPATAYEYTSRGNIVAVISNGTAVLGLGNQGALAAKPVMEGKAALFKKFADIDAIDIEINEPDPHKLIDIIAALEPSFGGINLEDIKAPECFIVEQTLVERMQIPVFHDDQHGTAIVLSAGLHNALALTGKSLGAVRIVINGAGAAALAIGGFLISLGADKQRITLCDTLGVVYEGRTANMNPHKCKFAAKTVDRTLADAMRGTDVFIGASSAGVVSEQMLKTMAKNPVVFALANPDPEIEYDRAIAVRPDLIMATGRSDFPNQVNNVLCFPFLFRGALDARARRITQAMKAAAAEALAALARLPAPGEVLDAYGVSALEFGPRYILPKPFDPRLRDVVAGAVLRAARQSGT